MGAAVGELNEDGLRAPSWIRQEKSEFVELVIASGVDSADARLRSERVTRKNCKY